MVSSEALSRPALKKENSMKKDINTLLEPLAAGLKSQTRIVTRLTNKSRPPRGSDSEISCLLGTDKIQKPIISNQARAVSRLIKSYTWTPYPSRGLFNARLGHKAVIVQPSEVLSDQIPVRSKMGRSISLAARNFTLPLGVHGNRVVAMNPQRVFPSVITRFPGSPQRGCQQSDGLFASRRANDGTQNQVKAFHFASGSLVARPLRSYPTAKRSCDHRKAVSEVKTVGLTVLKELIKTRAHLGTKSWEKNLSKYILGKRNSLYVFNLDYLIFSLKQVSKLIKSISQTETGARNAHILFVNTNTEYSELVKKTAEFSKQSYINQRWIGGTLTNWQIISKSISLYKKFSSHFDLFLIRNNIQIPLYQKAKKRYEGLLKLQPIAKSPLCDFTDLVSPLGGPAKRPLVPRPLCGMLGPLVPLKLGPIVSHSLKEMTINPEYLPDIIFLLNPDQNASVLNEAKIYKIPTIAFVDTNTKIENIDYPIPGNLKSIHFIYYCLNLITILFSTNDHLAGQHLHRKAP
jgi:small subunit ribosomal protein S2